MPGSARWPGQAAASKYTTWEPYRQTIEPDEGILVAERRNPAASFTGTTRSSPWDEFQAAYFASEANWNYFAAPFILSVRTSSWRRPGPWHEDGQAWRRPRHPPSRTLPSAVGRTAVGGVTTAGRTAADGVTAAGSGGFSTGRWMRKHVPGDVRSSSIRPP
jgi:hypothetical protein